MTTATLLGISTIDQFFDSGITSPTNEACGAACTLMIFRWLYPENKMTLLQAIEKTPLITMVAGKPVKAQNGLTCEQVMALCFRLGIDARLEYMSQVSLIEHAKTRMPTICLLKYGDIPMRFKQDKFNGFHFEVFDGFDDDNNCYLCDPDVISPNSGFGTNVKIPMSFVDRALQDSDQTRLCVVIYGKLTVQVDKIVQSATTLNLRIQPNLDSAVQTTIKKGDSVEVLVDDTVLSNKHTWLRVRHQNEIIGWCAQDLLIENSTPPVPVVQRTLPIGEGFVKSSGDQLNIRVSPNIAARSLGKLKALTPVMILEDAPVEKGDHIWYKVSSDTVTGWCAAEFLDTGIPPLLSSPMPRKAHKSYVGVHYLNSTNTQAFLDTAKRLADSGKPLACVTVVNDSDVSNSIKKLSPDTYVIFRIEDGSTPPYTPSDPNGAAKQWYNARITKLKQAPTANVYQFANEWGNSDIGYLSKFYAALADICHANGVACTMGDLAVGWVKDTEVALLKPMLDKANQYGFPVNYHAYGCNGDQGDINVMCAADFYVNRWRNWLTNYPSVKIIFGESGNFDAKYLGVDKTLGFIKQLNDNFVALNDTRVIGFCYWTFGGQNTGWLTSSIDEALPSIEGYCMSL